jgi:hypothetical protein
MAENDNIDENTDEEETEEIGFDVDSNDSSEETSISNSDFEESDYPTTDIPPADLVDLIANQKASEAKSEIFRSLYNKVGERIEGLKSEIRKSSE